MVEITWLGHGTFQLRLSTGDVFLMDPWTEGNPAYPAEHKIERVDAILISHGHFDHIHDAVPLAKKFGTSLGTEPPVAKSTFKSFTLNGTVPADW